MDSRRQKTQQMTGSGRAVLGLDVSSPSPGDQVPTQGQHRRGVLHHNLKWSHSPGQNRIASPQALLPGLDARVSDPHVLKATGPGRMGDEVRLAARTLNENKVHPREGDGQGQPGKPSTRSKIDHAPGPLQNLELEGNQGIGQVVVKDPTPVPHRGGSQGVSSQYVDERVELGRGGARKPESANQSRGVCGPLLGQDSAPSFSSAPNRRRSRSM